MRVMVLVKGDGPADQVPSEEMLLDMGKFNEELVKAGVMLAGEGLRPSVFGKRVELFQGKATVTDGPFAEAKELVGGFWIWQVKSIDEAVEWVKRCPMPKEVPCTLEIRPVAEVADFGESATPEVRAQEERLRAKVPH